MKDKQFQDLMERIDKLKANIDEDAKLAIDAIVQPNSEAYKALKKSALFASMKFHYDSRIARCKWYALVFPFFRELNCTLNTLIKRFDGEVIQVRREQQGNVLGLDMPNAQHLCFIAPHKTKRTGIFSEMYNDHLPPDKRLIYIGLDHSIWRTAISVLHEVGHFIGIRKRVEERVECFIRLITHALSFHIFNDFCATLAGKSTMGSLIVNYYNQGDVPSAASSDAELVNEYIQNTFKPGLEARLRQDVKTRIGAIKETLSPKGSNYDDRSFVERIDIATVMGYFRYIRPIIMGSLVDYLNETLDHIKENEKLINVNALDKLQDVIRDRYDETNTYYLSGKIPPWYQTREEQLEETIADIFMMKISGVSISDFLENIIYQYQLTTGTKNVSLSIGTLLPRVISVCMAMNASESDFSRWYDHILDFLPFDFAIKCRYETRMRLYKCYVNAKETGSISDSYKILIDYSKSIWEQPQTSTDSPEQEPLPSYDKFLIDNNTLIEQIRKLLCRKRLYFKILYWLIPTLHEENEMGEEFKAYTTDAETP